ncbi:MAG: hypothetical protein QG597_4770 [Actinomycetota bacterium]|nr:hypothetical protein [Actinomycetota bacterium]
MIAMQQADDHSYSVRPDTIAEAPLTRTVPHE